MTESSTPFTINYDYRYEDVDGLTLAIDSIQFDDCWTQKDLVDIHIEPRLYIHISRQKR